MRVAIIGAGIAGLACAEALQASGCEVVLFDKSRAAGGRMSTRRVATAFGDAHFDHGAQYFTVQHPALAQRVECWRANGVALPWPAAGADAWVGVPGMTAPAKAMAAGCDVRWSTHVAKLLRLYSGWRIVAVTDAAIVDRASDTGAVDDSVFDAVVVAVPAEQAAGLLAPVHPEYAADAGGVLSAPCWTLMLAFAERLAASDDILCGTGVIGWAARNSAKPGRSGPEAWVVQASPAWSAAQLEQTTEAVAAALQCEFAAFAGIDLPEPLVSIAHRWRYARSGAFGQPALWDADAAVGVCGDWLIGPRVEAAWLSGTALAGQIIAGS